MKKIIAIVLVVILVAAIGIKLSSNKKTMTEKTKKSDIKNEYPVNVAQVVKQKLTESLSIIGNVLGNNDVMVVSETVGRVVSVHTKVGQTIGKGGLIAKVDDELKVANLHQAEANYEKAKKDFDRAESLLAAKSMTDSQYDGFKFALKSAEINLTIAKRQVADTKIMSPISGIVVSRQVDVGSAVDGKSIVANVVDVSTLKVKLNVPESIIFKLKAGQSVEIASEAIPGVTFKGKIDNISVKGDEAHTFPIEVTVQNSGKVNLKAGMFARVFFNSISEREGLIVPRKALIGSSKDASIFVIENGIAKLKKLVLGTESNGMVEVVAGLNENDTVVVSGQNNLKDGVQATIVK